VTGQYTNGAIAGGSVPGYIDELGKPSGTETFVGIKAFIDNWRWSGVPFYLRTGKRLPKRTTEIVVQFRAVPHSMFAQRGAVAKPNRLIIGIQPEENITLELMTKVPGLDRDGVRLREVPLDIRMADAFAGPTKRIAYERLLLDLIEGDQTLFVHRDEVEAQWTWIDGVRAAGPTMTSRPSPIPRAAGAPPPSRWRQGWRDLARMIAWGSSPPHAQELDLTLRRPFPRGVRKDALRVNRHASSRYRARDRAHHRTLETGPHPLSRHDPCRGRAPWRAQPVLRLLEPGPCLCRGRGRPEDHGLHQDPQCGHRDGL
jgi:hypothetical protein